MSSDITALQKSFFRLPLHRLSFAPAEQNQNINEYLDKNQYFELQSVEIPTDGSNFSSSSMYHPSEGHLRQYVSAFDNPLPTPDVIILCGEGAESREFFAHKFILHIRSRILQNLPNFSGWTSFCDHYFSVFYC